MKVVIFSLILAALFFADKSSADDKEKILVDIPSEINRRLALKPSTTRIAQVAVKKEECRIRGCGGVRHDGYCDEVCSTKTAYESHPYQDQHRILSIVIQSVSELKLGDAEEVNLPVQLYEKVSRVENCSSVQQSVTQQLSLTVDRTEQYSVTRGVQTSYRVDGSAKWGDYGVGGSVSRQISLNTSQQQTLKNAENHSYTAPVVVPAKSYVASRIWVSVKKMRAKFTGDILIDGDLVPSATSARKLSDVLSEDERKIFVEGYFEFDNASELNSRIEQAALDCVTRNEVGGSVSSSTLERVVPIPSSRAGPRGWQLFFRDVGAICYEGPCSLPLDGTRQVCKSSEQGCDDCSFESSPVCDPPAPPPDSQGES